MAKIKFLGASGTVTGSSFLLSSADSPQVLVDMEKGRQIALDLLEITEKQISEELPNDSETIQQAGRIFDF